MTEDRMEIIEAHMAEMYRDTETVIRARTMLAELLGEIRGY